MIGQQGRRWHEKGGQEGVYMVGRNCSFPGGSGCRLIPRKPASAWKKRRRAAEGDLKIDRGSGGGKNMVASWALKNFFGEILH